MKKVFAKKILLTAFQVTPMNYAQLFIIFALIGSSVWLPVFYALMPNRTEQTYERTYNLIDMALAAQGLQFNNDMEVMADFELAQRRPWGVLHPSHRVRGCLFHFREKLDIFFCILFKMSGIIRGGGD